MVISSRLKGPRTKPRQCMRADRPWHLRRDSTPPAPRGARDAAQDVQLLAAELRAVEQLVQARHQPLRRRRGRESRSPRSTSSQCASAACTSAASARSDCGVRGAHVEAAERLPPFVGDHLHGLRQVERAVAGTGGDAQARRGSGTHRRWPCRNARRRTRTPPPVASPANAGRRARGANARRSEVARRHRRGASELHAVERLVERCTTRASRQDVVGATGHGQRLRLLQHIGDGAAPPAPGRENPSPSSHAPPRPRCRHGSRASARSACDRGVKWNRSRHRARR